MAVPRPTTRFPTAVKPLITTRVESVPAALLFVAVGPFDRASAGPTAATDAATRHSSTATRASSAAREIRIVRLLFLERSRLGVKHTTSRLEGTAASRYPRQLRINGPHAHQRG